MTNCDIIHNWSYRDNPRNTYHQTYQAMTNRLFGVFMVSLVEVLVWSYFGFVGVFMSAPMAFIGAVCLAIVLMALGGIIDILGEFLEWVWGY
jgi:hypothetical protein